MRRLLIIASLAGSFIVFSLSVNLFDALFMFVFFGVVPFQLEPIPAVQMLIVYMCTGVVVLSFAARGWIVSLLRTLQRKPSRVEVS